MANCPRQSLNFVRRLTDWQKFKFLKQWDNDAVKYDNIKYYPRRPDHVDPEFTPTKLLMVHRVKPFKGNPYWDKEMMLRIGLEERGNKPVIVKNTPDVCGMLWKIKHLIKITPIKLPDKLPNPDDLGGCHLHENGTFEVIPKVDPTRITAIEEYQNNPKKFNNKLITEKLRLQWIKTGFY